MKQRQKITARQELFLRLLLYNITTAYELQHNMRERNHEITS